MLNNAHLFGCLMAVMKIVNKINRLHERALQKAYSDY